jgi:hypothetical protein
MSSSCVVERLMLQNVIYRLYAGRYSTISSWIIIMVSEFSCQHEAIFCIVFCVVVVVISVEGLDFTVEVIGFC